MWKLCKGYPPESIGIRNVVIFENFPNTTSMERRRRKKNTPRRQRDDYIYIFHLTLAYAINDKIQKC